MPHPERMPGLALLDTRAIRALETNAARELGDDGELMRRAGLAAWQALLSHWPQACRLLVVCGPGNNGGDGYLLALHALLAGRQVHVIALPGPDGRVGPAARAQAEFRSAGGVVVGFGSSLPPADLVVDAVFGIGLNRAPEGLPAALIEAINMHPAPVFALDAPSGLDSERASAPGVCVRATRTLEFIAPKLGLRTGDASDHCGTLACASLGIDAAALAPAGRLVTAPDLRRWLAPRMRNSHKGRSGRVLCMGGDHGMGGAVVLCAEAALRSGAGLLEVTTRARHHSPLLARLPEAMARDGADLHAVQAACAASDCVAVGPGIGQQAWGAALLASALDSGRPLVLDADALNLLARDRRSVPADAVITPHPGEAARLLGTTAAEVQRDRVAAVRALTEGFGCVAVLKGAGTLVAAPDGRLHVIGAGNPGMAVGGMGDVLTGVIAALRAQGLSAYDAAACGALLHSVAGDSAASTGERGMLPTDLMPWLRRHANPELPT